MQGVALDVGESNPDEDYGVSAEVAEGGAV